MTTRAEAIASATAIASRAWGELAQAAAEGGPEAVAQLAHEPGGMSREEITARYAAMQDQERQRGGATAA